MRVREKNNSFKSFPEPNQRWTVYQLTPAGWWCESLLLKREFWKQKNRIKIKKGSGSSSGKSSQEQRWFWQDLLMPPPQTSAARHWTYSSRMERAACVLGIANCFPELCKTWLWRGVWISLLWDSQSLSNVDAKKIYFLLIMYCTLSLLSHRSF